ncbi:hypothetical protein H0H81_009279 [Sphagnurus paluster]|uniref:polynucleotide adenylyltransferase n=1 Tax=Sphagnurus paluster TaxID=117069 RepID=A0A9P7GW27_9AGAR|nr:hypothetical protein H0H81_009279 [Sphagnurus paluster]
MQRRSQATKMRFVADLSQCLFDFVIQLLPTTEEMAVKEDVRKLLERLIRTIEPDSRLLSFGSTANGFSLRNSDMDLCCLIDSKERLAATDLVTMLGDLLERETKFHVKPLPHARIPIVKLSLDPSPGLPLGIACDIGFENRLALENTRLLMCYAMIDPTRVRTMVLFLKVWSKRRKINSPYKGTLSSYGYVLLVIYFLVHVKNPPVLPNLQQMPPLRPITTEDTHLAGYNTWFFDDIELLRQRWHSDNTESVGELLIDFFRYYSRDFSYNTGVASIRAGLLKKDSKGWQNDLSGGRYNDSRERNRLCIEDPFETDFNVARCVTKDGLYTIRGEFMRASRVLSTRPERAIIALAELCEERKEEDLISAPPFASSRMSFPPQTPYTIGSQPMRAKGGPPPERLSPPTKFFEPGPRHSVTIRPPPPEHMPEHMAPKRSKWTSPPPAEAPSADHSLFESQLGMGLEMATSSTEAREKETSAYHSSSSNSEFLTDEETRSEAAESDDVTSVRSYTEGSTMNGSGGRRPSWHTRDATAIRLPQASNFSAQALGGRVRYPRETTTNSPIPTLRPAPLHTPIAGPAQSPISLPCSRINSVEVPRQRVSPRPPRPAWPSSLSSTPLGVSVPLPPSPDCQSQSHSPSLAEHHRQPLTEPSTVFYQTTGVPRSPCPKVVYPTPGNSHASLLAQYQTHGSPHSHHTVYQTHSSAHIHGPNTMSITPTPVEVPRDIFPPSMPAFTSMNRDPRAHVRRGSSGGPDTPTPTTYAHPQVHQHHHHHQHQHHAHSLSNATVTAPTPPPHSHLYSSPTIGPSSPRLPASSPSIATLPQPVSLPMPTTGCPATVSLPVALSTRRIPRSPPLPTLTPTPSPVTVPLAPTSADNVAKNNLPATDPHARFIAPRAEGDGASSPQSNSNGSSPAPSSTGYTTSLSRSPSPSPPPTAIPPILDAQFGAKEIGKMGRRGSEDEDEGGKVVIVIPGAEGEADSPVVRGAEGDGA